MLGKHMSGIGEEIHVVFSGTLCIWINNLQHTCSNIMAIRVVEFSSGVYKIEKIFA